jgi:CHAD domain-containing protein
VSYRCKPGEPVEAGLRRVALDQLERAFAELDDDALDVHATVHQVRKRCKKVRGLLRLVRPALAGDVYARENGALRDAAGGLSDLRDAEARIETFDALVADYGDALDGEAFGLVRRALCARRARERDSSASRADAVGRLERFRASLGRVRERAEGWSLEAEGYEAVRGGLKKTYGRARRALAAAYADGSTEAFHDWRKRVKYHGYHLRLLREVWRPATKMRRGQLDRLSDLLGDEHDLAVLRRHLLDHPVRGIDGPTAEALHGLVAARRARLRREALPLGQRLLAERPKAFARRLGAWFEVAWGDGPAAGLDETRGLSPPGPSPAPAP